VVVDVLALGTPPSDRTAPLSVVGAAFGHPATALLASSETRIRAARRAGGKALK
jgi:hypothetical protein